MPRKSRKIPKISVQSRPGPSRRVIRKIGAAKKPMTKVSVKVSPSTDRSVDKISFNTVNRVKVKIQTTGTRKTKSTSRANRARAYAVRRAIRANSAKRSQAAYGKPTQKKGKPKNSGNRPLTSKKNRDKDLNQVSKRLLDPSVLIDGKGSSSSMRRNGVNGPYADVAMSKGRNRNYTTFLSNKRNTFMQGIVRGSTQKHTSPSSSKTGTRMKKPTQSTSRRLGLLGGVSSSTRSTFGMLGSSGGAAFTGSATRRVKQISGKKAPAGMSSSKKIRDSNDRNPDKKRHTVTKAISPTAKSRLVTKGSKKKPSKNQKLSIMTPSIRAILDPAISAGKFLQPRPTIKVFHKPRPPEPPPDIPARTSDDEFKIQEISGLSEVMQESAVSSYRPEIVAMLEYLPYTLRTQQGRVSKLLYMRYRLKKELVRSVSMAIRAMERSNVSGTFDALKSNLSYEDARTKSFISLMSDILKQNRLMKMALDISSPYTNTSIAKAAVRSSDYRRVNGGKRFPKPSYYFRTRLGFSGEGYKKFTNTKIIGQIVLDLRHAIEKCSLTVFDEEIPARLKDHDPVKYNRNFTNDQSYTFSLDRLGEFSPAAFFDADNENSFYDFYDQLPDDGLDRIRLLIVSLSRELTMSAGIAFLSGKTLGNRYGVETNPLNMSLGDVGNDITDSKSPGGSIADYLSIGAPESSTILPFEDDFINDADREFVPGTHAFVNSVLTADGTFNTEPLKEFSRGFSNAAADTFSLLVNILNLDDDDGRCTPVDIFSLITSEMQDAASGMGKRNINTNKAVTAALCLEAANNSKLRYMLFRYMLELTSIDDDTSTRPTSESMRVGVSPYSGIAISSRSNTNVSVFNSINSRLFSSIYTPSVVSQANLALFTMSNPLSGLVNDITDELMLNASAVRPANAKGFNVKKITPQLVRRVLYSQATSKRGVGIFDAIQDTFRSLISRANAVASRDGFKRTFFDNGRTRWHSLDQKAVMLLIFEICMQVSRKMLSMDVIRVRDKVYLAYRKEVNIAAINSLEYLDAVYETPREERQATTKRKAARDIEETILASKSESSNKLLSRFQVRRIKREIKSLQKVRKFQDERISELLDMLEDFEQDAEFIKESAVMLRAYSRKVLDSSNRFNNFYTAKNNKELEGNLKTLKTTKFGKRIIAGLNDTQLRLMRYAYEENKPRENTDTYLSSNRLFTSARYRALYSVLRHPSLSGVSAENLKVLAVGIPDGLVNALKNPPVILRTDGDVEIDEQQNPTVVEVRIYKRDLEYSEIIFKPKKMLVDTSLFIESENFSLDKWERFENAIKQFKFTRCTSSGTSVLEIKELMKHNSYRGLSKQQVGQIISNTTLDRAMKDYYDIMAGLSLDESAFTGDVSIGLDLDNDGRDVLILAESMPATSPYITTGEVPVSQMFDIDYRAEIAGLGDLIGGNTTVKDITRLKDKVSPSIFRSLVNSWRSLQEISRSRITEIELLNFRALCSSVIFSPSVMKERVIIPKVFERIFTFPVDPDNFEIDVNATLQSELGAKRWSMKTLKESSEVFYDKDGNEHYRFKPRPRKENFSAFNEFYVQVSSVGEES